MIDYRERPLGYRSNNNDWDIFINNTSTDKVNYPNIVLVSRVYSGLTLTNTYFKTYDLAKDIEFYTDNTECSFLGKLVFYSSSSYTDIIEPSTSYISINFTTFSNGCDPVTYNYDAIIKLDQYYGGYTRFFDMRAYAPDNSVSKDFTLRLVFCGAVTWTKNSSHPVFQAANTQIDAIRRLDYLN